MPHCFVTQGPRECRDGAGSSRPPPLTYLLKREPARGEAEPEAEAGPAA